LLVWFGIINGLESPFNRKDKFMKTNFKRGFTLIELLVVVAIIAILTGVILTSTSASRAKGANAGVKTNLRTVMQQTELLYLNNIPNAYGTDSHSIGPCAQTAGTPFSNTVIWAAILEAQKQSGGTMPTCAANPSAYVVSALLKSKEGNFNYWCIDSQGNAKGEIGNISGPICD